jgi:hypothetical protein
MQQSLLKQGFGLSQASSEADLWGSLFRAATTFTEARTGAKKSVGHGGSPRGCRLRLVWSDAPTSKMTSVPRGRLKPMSSFPVADSSETSPWVGTVKLLLNLRRSCKLRLYSYRPKSSIAFLMTYTLYGGLLGGTSQPGISIKPRGALSPFRMASLQRS